MGKFDWALSREEKDEIINLAHDRDGAPCLYELVDRIEQAVLAKLAEQEPVAWASSKIDGHYVPHDVKIGAANWFKKKLDIPLYTHPMPGIQGILDGSNQEDIQDLPPLPEADVYGYRDSYSEELMLEYAKSAIDHHRTTKNHIADMRKKVPEGWQLVPKEPTPEMIKAADVSDEIYSKRSFGEGIHLCQGGYDHYKAMLATAPKYTGDSNE